MNFNNITISEKLVPFNYLNIAENAQKSKEREFKELLEKRKLPEHGWPDHQIEELIRYLSTLDSNNFPNKAGVGEREARIVCALVARRHYNFGHGIGRSGDLLEAQPKAAGSTLMANLTNALLLDLIRQQGVRSCKRCFLVPMATGMTLTLCMLSLRKQRPEAKYVLWSRIDQKSCFKSITTAGLTPIVVQPIERQGELSTNINEFENHIKTLGANSILCLFATSSCFAPRNCDDLTALAQLAQKFNIPHLINNAYGLQSTFITHQLEQAHKQGRVDLFVQSTDKNLMVPVGGAVVAGFEEQLVENVAKSYAGRASCSQSLDVFMTLLSLGIKGYTNLVQQRKSNFQYLHTQLSQFATDNHLRLIKCKQNPISIALILNQENGLQPNFCQFGSMLYTRGVSGARVVVANESKTIDNYAFENWGTHHSELLLTKAYLTVAASLGITREEIDTFLEKLQTCWNKFSQGV